ncbi:MAG: DUF1751 domain-containing protein [Bacteroidetes bacterium]|nr:MAG: DUF1751 domain-containing protein [Bacteroidota bacterium]
MTEFRSRNFQALPIVIKNLLIINTLVYLAQFTLDSSFEITMKFALFPLNSELFKPYQLFTYMFLHGGWGHLIFNMFALWMFGTQLENFWGPKRFIIFYLICGVAAGVAELLFMAPVGYAVGASGAIMGVFAAFGYLFPNNLLIFFPIPIPIKAKWAVIGLMALDLFGGLSNSASDNVAHFAHLGGAVTGIILVWIWNKSNRKTFY